MSTFFWNMFADRYSKQPIANQEAYEKKLTLSQQYLESDFKVLEIGCGTGGTALEHAGHVNHILATDTSRRMIEIAEARRIEAGVENVTFKESDLFGAGTANESLDAVLALNILHLLPSYQDALEYIFEQLKPGGLLISSTPCIDFPLWHPLRIGIAVLGPLGLMPKVKFVTREVLKKAMTDIGFAIVDELPPADPTSNMQAAFVIIRKPSSSS